MNPASLAWLVPLPVLIPMVSAGAALVASRHPRIQQVIALAGMLAATIVGVFLIFGAAQGPIVLDVGSWAAPIGITPTMRADLM